MKKFFLTTCLIIMASLAFSQGYFSEKEVKDLGLEVKYDKFNDYYIYNLKSKNKKEYKGGQNENFYFEIWYNGKEDYAWLYVSFRYAGSNYINISRAQVYIDGQTMDFKPNEYATKQKIEYPKYWLYVERFSEGLYTYRDKDMKILNFFYLGFEDAKDVSIRLYGKTGYEQYKLTKKEIQASDRIISIFMDKEFEDED